MKSDTIFRVSPWGFSVLNGEHQANGDAGGAIQHWQDHLHPVSAGAGES